MLTKAPGAGILIAIGLISVAGCHENSARSGVAESQVVAEGIIYYVEYELDDGRTGGFTRVNSPKAVPGSEGSWNIDAHGRLTRDYLVVTYPQKNDLGPRVIPARRLVDLQFGDGGITSISETASPD